MSNDYGLILPLMIAAVSASYLSQVLFNDSMYTAKLTRRGIRFVQGRDMDIMQGVMVREVMTDAPVVVEKTAPLARLYQLFQETNYLGFPVVDEKGLLYGIVTLQDLEKALTAGNEPLRELKVSDVAIVDPVTVYPDEPIWTAIQKMAPRDLARLPVVSRSSDKTLIGLISRSNILRAYDVGIVRKQRGQLLQEKTTLRREEKNVFIEVRLHKDDYAVGIQLKDLGLSDAVNVVSIERNGSLLIPKGSSRFKSGDIVTLFARKEAVELAKMQFTHGKENR